jgi:glyoxylate utilization-related uncharacterized protein
MSTPNDRAVETVRYVLRTAIRKTVQSKDYCLKQESYSRWAAKEIMTLLLQNRDTPPLLVIEQFRDKMDRYSCINIETSYQFSVAKDMADWIIDLLIG